MRGFVRERLDRSPHICRRSRKSRRLPKRSPSQSRSLMGGRAHPLGSLASHLSPDQKIPTLAETLVAAKAISDEWDRAQALGLLAPHLSPDQKIQTLAEALAAAKAFGDEGARAQALGSLAPHLSPGQIVDALAAAKAISSEIFRAEVLESLAPHVSTIHYARLLDSFVEVAARLPRGDALHVVSTSMRISAALGGAEELLQIRRAIGDTARWFP
jgi:hypothetical protein